MNNPNYMSTTHDIHRPKNVDHDIVEQFQPSFVKMDRHVTRAFRPLHARPTFIRSAPASGRGPCNLSPSLADCRP